ncbi:MAG TPA: hypothetical protein VJV04_11260 [Nitrospiraceae bacterium]|nr:hypothetical protein [Nitrospiraceae bacterium]
MMRVLSALLVGLFSGFLTYMIFGLVIGPRDVSPLFVMTTFLGGWAFTTYVVLIGAATAPQVWSRGGLLGAVEWLLLGLTMWVYSGRTLAENENAGDALGAALNPIIGIGLAMCMAIPCLIIYVMASRVSNKSHSD